MPRTLAALLLLSLAACSEEEPPPPAPPAPVAAPAPAPPPPEAKSAEVEKPKPDPNAELAARVKRALEGEARVQAAAIDVTAADGKVTLWGTAGTTGERSRAARVAGEVEGVKSVDNRISVVRGS
ncbi:MAG TPA: BON domain-containing protein [Burkholderiales bacterium]